MALLERERFRFTYLLISLLVVILLQPLLDRGRTGSVIVGGALIVTLLSAIKACAGKRGVLMAAAILASPAVFLVGADSMMQTTRLTPARTAAIVLFLVFTMVVVLRDVARGKEVTLDTIQGAIVAYLLIGFSWAYVYTFIELVHPGAFRHESAVLQPGNTEPMIYFSFVTLTTLGYGDMSPQIPIARTLCWLESATGQIYLTVLIARLIGLHTHHRS